MDALQARQKIPVAAEIIQTVETAHRGVHGAVQLEVPHILLQEKGSGVSGQLLHGGIGVKSIRINAKAGASLLKEAVGAVTTLIACLGQHLGTAVNADHIVPPIGQGKSHAPRAAGQIQHDLGLGGEKSVEAGLDKITPPLVVHVGIESVVGGGDGAVSVVHRCPRVM